MDGGGAGFGHEDWDCGQLARIEVNGFPICAHHFEEYEREGLVESVAVIADQPAPTETYARGTAIWPPACATCGQFECFGPHSVGHAQYHPFVAATERRPCGHLIRDGQTTIGACELERCGRWRCHHGHHARFDRIDGDDRW